MSDPRTVRELAWLQVAVPLTRPLQAGALVISEREYCCVRVVLGDGASGEAFVLTRGLDVVGALSDVIAPRVLGQPYGGMERRVRVGLRNVGWDGAISRAASAVSIACLDARARRDGVPAWRLFADTAPRPSETAAVIGYTPVGETPDEIADAERADDEGVRWVKLMGGFAAPEVDLARVEAVVSAIGDHCSVALDVNGAWPYEIATDLLPKLVDSGVDFVEEPWPYELGLAGFSALGTRPRPRLAFGEVSASVIELEALAASGQVDYLRPDATLIGGPETFAGLLDRISGPAVMPHFWPEVHRHLVAAYSGTTCLEYAPAESGGFGLDRFVDGVATVVDGRVAIPDSAGFGYSLDWDALAALAGASATTRRDSRCEPSS